MDKIILVRWDTQLGPKLIIQYPPEKEIPMKDLFVKIWAKYELQKEKPLIVLTEEDVDKNYLAIAQFFEGELYFFIFKFEQLQKDQNFEDYSEILASISKNVFQLIHSDKFMRALSEGYNQIKNFVKLGKEQNILNLFKDKIKRNILNILENGVISKSDLINKLKHDFGFSAVNIDLLLSSFLKEGVIIKKDLPGIKESIFLVKDLACVRIPPNQMDFNLNEKKGKIKKSQETLHKSILKKLNEFFTNFDIISEIKNNSLYTLFFDETTYNLIRILRKKSITIEEALSLLENKQEIFEDLLDKEIIIERKGVVYLFSDIRFISFLPIFILKNLMDRYNNLEITSDQYIAHIEILLAELNKKKKEIYKII